MTSGSSVGLRRRRCRHHHGRTLALQPAGQDPEARLVPGTVTLPLCSRTNASPFWIMLLRVWGRLEHGMIPALATGFGIVTQRICRGEPMERRQLGQLDAPAAQEGIAGNEEGVGPLTCKSCESRIDLADGADVEDLNLQP